MKSIVNSGWGMVTLSMAVLWMIAPCARADRGIERVVLDDDRLLIVPVATNRVTTLCFPSAISGIDGAGVTLDAKTPAGFQLAHTKGSAFLSVRALLPKAAGNLNIRCNGHTYVVELTESNQPVLCLHLEAPMPPDHPGRGWSLSPLNLLALLDKARAFALLKTQHPESVADVKFTTYDGHPLVSDFGDYEIRIEQAFRFDLEDTLVFRLVLTNKTAAPFFYQPDSFALRLGSRHYPQSLSDADGHVAPHGQSLVFFAVTGTPEGGRNELSLKNPFAVLLTRQPHPPSPEREAATPAPGGSPPLSPDSP